MTEQGELPEELVEQGFERGNGGTEDAWYQRYRFLVEEAEDILYMLDSEGRYVLVNDSMTEITGYSREELLGNSPEMVLSDADLEKGENRIMNLIESAERETDTWTVTLISKDGKRIPCELRFTLLPTQDGEYEGIVGVGRDIRERKRREQKLQVMTRVLRHNIRNKLGLVMGKADLLRTRAEEDDYELTTEQIICTADQLESNAREMVELSEKVRTIQERIRSVPESDIRTDVAKLGRAVVQQHRAAYPDATINFEAPTSVYARVPESYEIALSELIENAIEHAEFECPTVRVEITRENGEVVTTVVDDCPEIPETEREVLREERETDLTHSAGVGLWLVYWVTKTAEGSLDFEYTGKGNRVKLRFKAAETR